MTYEEGRTFMIEATRAHKEIHNSEYRKIKAILNYSPITIEYPGYKANGDYKAWYKTEIMDAAEALTHTDIVQTIFNKVTKENFNEYIDFLECVFLYGLQCSNTGNLKYLIFWLTLHEDINYPMAAGKQGRKLPFQRYYEAILAKLGHYKLDRIVYRTNNHGSGIPSLLAIPSGIKKPVFYDLDTKF